MKSKNRKINFYKFPDKFGRFGKFGGRFVAETLMPLLLEVLPAFPNLYKDIKLSPTDTSFLPPSGDPVVGPSSNLATTQNIQQKGQQVFGTNDSVFGG